MDNEKKNNNADSDIDEHYLMSIMAGSSKKEVPEEKNNIQKDKDTSKNKLKSRKSSDLNYVEHFLTHHTMTKRGDKSIYIRPEYHERLSRIIQIIADDQIPLYAYLDNILAYHFEMFEKEITEDFNKKYRPIF